MNQAKPFIKVATLNQEIIIAIGTELQMVETLDFIRNLSYILRVIGSPTPLSWLIVSNCTLFAGINIISTIWQRRCWADSGCSDN